MNNYEKDYLDLKSKIAEMSTIVTKMIKLSIQALLSRNAETAIKVIEMDRGVDHLDIEIDELSLKILALYDPKAHDLRHIIGVSRIIVDLERIGDYAVNICKEILIICKLSECEYTKEISLMGKITVEMIKGGINAFFQKDIEQAKSVIIQDGEVNALNSLIIRELINSACDKKERTQTIMSIMAIARSLERIGDHAKNISESAYFLVEGKFVRHAHITNDNNE